MNFQKTCIFNNNKTKFKTIMFFFIQEYLNSFKFKLYHYSDFTFFSNLILFFLVFHKYLFS